MIRKSLMILAISLLALTTLVATGTAFAHGSGGGGGFYGGGGGFHSGGSHNDDHASWGHGWGDDWHHHSYYGYGFPVYIPYCYITLTGEQVCY